MMLKFLGVILTLYLCGNFTLKWICIFENKTTRNGVNLRTEVCKSAEVHPPALLVAEAESHPAARHGSGSVWVPGSSSSSSRMAEAASHPATHSSLIYSAEFAHTSSQVTWFWRVTRPLSERSNDDQKLKEKVNLREGSHSIFLSLVTQQSLFRHFFSSVEQ